MKPITKIEKIICEALNAKAYTLKGDDISYAGEKVTFWRAPDGTRFAITISEDES